jgi:hypothetical protein
VRPGAEPLARLLLYGAARLGILKHFIDENNMQHGLVVCRTGLRLHNGVTQHG